MWLDLGSVRRDGPNLIEIPTRCDQECTRRETRTKRTVKKGNGISESMERERERRRWQGASQLKDAVLALAFDFRNKTVERAARNCDFHHRTILLSPALAPGPSPGRNPRLPPAPSIPSQIDCFHRHRISCYMIIVYNHASPSSYSPASSLVSSRLGHATLLRDAS